MQHAVGGTFCPEDSLLLDPNEQIRYRHLPRSNQRMSPYGLLGRTDDRVMMLSLVVRLLNTPRGKTQFATFSCLRCAQ